MVSRCRHGNTQWLLFSRLSGKTCCFFLFETCAVISGREARREMSNKRQRRVWLWMRSVGRTAFTDDDGENCIPALSFYITVAVLWLLSLYVFVRDSLCPCNTATITVWLASDRKGSRLRGENALQIARYWLPQRASIWILSIFFMMKAGLSANELKLNTRAILALLMRTKPGAKWVFSTAAHLWRTRTSYLMGLASRALSSPPPCGLRQPVVRHWAFEICLGKRESTDESLRTDGSEKKHCNLKINMTQWNIDE